MWFQRMRMEKDFFISNIDTIFSISSCSLNCSRHWEAALFALAQDKGRCPLTKITLSTTLANIQKLMK